MLPRIAALTCLLLAAPALRAADPSFPARAQALQVVKPGAETEDFKFRPFNSAPGTKVVVLVSSPDLMIVAVDDSAVTAMTDNKGTDLTAPPAGAKKVMRFGSMGHDVSDDKRHALITLDGPGVPVAGATQVTLKGTVSLVVGKEQRTDTVSSPAVGKLAVTGEDVALKSIGESQGWGGTQMEAKAAYNFDLKGATVKRFAGAVFKDASGNAIKSHRASSMTINDEQTVEFHVPKDAKVGSIDLLFWKDAQVVSVPVDVTLSLGL